MAYIQKICDLSRRGDIDAVADLMKGYFSDKTNNPWDTLYRTIEKLSKKDGDTKELREIFILLREGVFGALEILSFCLIPEITTRDIIQVFTKEKDWSLGRRKTRNLCLNIADGLIEKGNIRYLLPSSLKREGFGFLTSRIEEEELEQFRKAEPKISRGKLDLSKLQNSIIGCRFLREQSITETKLEKDDSRIELLQEAYQLQLVELEFERTTRTKAVQDTEQITLNGQPVTNHEDEKVSPSRKKKTLEIQTPLSEFIPEQKSSGKEKGSKRRARKK